MVEWITLAVILVGICISATRLRGVRWLRITWQLIVVLYIGFTAGTVLSLASFFGWAQTGLPQGAASLVLLTVAAFAIPLFTKRNVYCSHLCPHGAVQQLALKFAKPRYSVPSRWRWLANLPLVLLFVALLVSVTHAPFSLVDLEPFDAYLFRIAGWATITIAVISFIASCFIPMAYCRYGCATGAMLEYVRLHAKSDQIGRLDLFVIAAIVLANLM